VAFFSQIHRSIFDPSFYREVLYFKGTRVFGFYIRIIVFTAFITGLAKTYYFVDLKWGIPARIELAFKGMEIRNGFLNPNRETPYYPPSYHIAPLLNQIFSIPHFFDSIPDSFIVVDTGKQAWVPGHEPFMILRSAHVELHPNPKSTFKFPYTLLLGGGKDLIFTAEHVRAFLMRNIIGITFNSIIWSGIVYSGMVLFSIFFLALAAYIFRVDRGRNWFQYVRLACFASSPITIGSMLIALSGVKLPWTWHVLIFLSTIVMFRAILATNSKLPGVMNKNE